MNDLYGWPVAETAENLLTYTKGNIVPVVERGGKRYAGRVVEVVMGKPGGTMLIKVEWAGPWPKE